MSKPGASRPAAASTKLVDSIAKPRRQRVLHAFKIYFPEVFGGIPYAIAQAMVVRPDLFEHELLVCSTDPDAEQNRMEGVERVRSFGNLMSLPLAPLYPFRLWQKMRDADAVVLHAPFPLADLVLGLGLRRRVPLIVYWHSDIVSQKFFGRLLRPLLMATLNRASAILLSDPRILHRQELVDRFGAKLKALPYPVDLSRFILTHEEAKKVEALRTAYPRMVLAVGRLVKYKGYDVLIEAARSINGQIVIIGDGIEREALARDIASGGMEDRVLMPGSLSERDLIVHLHAAQVYTMPSVTNAETFGIAQLEAMAAGCPIVNTALETAVPLVARDGIEAITVAPRDAVGLAQAINLLLDDPKMHQSRADAAKMRAASFSTDAFASVCTEAICDAASAKA